MASCSLRLRRALTTLSTVNRYVCSTPTVLSAPTSISFSITTPPFTSPPSQFTTKLARGFSPFKLSSMSFSSDRYFNKDEIGPDTILFEGCDYNHWLITMDFPKDPKPTPEEMVRTYEETCAKGLNISLEEAKQRMYACSTTTYQGFQAVMTEEESEKFKDIPGVVFILPDSYIDPQNKEYGGDKYINGTIIPRPPPVQYGRQGGRFRDRNRNPDPPRYDGGWKPNWQENNPSNNQQGPMQRDGRDFGASQNYSPPQPGYGQPGQGEMRGGSMPPYQGNNQGGQGGYNNQGGRGNYYPQRDQRGYGPPPRQGGFGQGDNRGYGPLPQGGPYGQGQGGYQGQGANQGGNWQGAGSGYGPGYQGHGDGQRNGQGEETLYTPTGQPGSYQGRY